MKGKALQSYSVGNKENANSNNIHLINQAVPCKASRLPLDTLEKLKDFSERLTAALPQKKQAEEINESKQDAIQLSDSYIPQQRANSTVDTVTEPLPKENNLQKFDQGFNKLGKYIEKQRTKKFIKDWKLSKELRQLKICSFIETIKGLITTSLHRRFLIWMYRSSRCIGIIAIKRRTLSKAFEIIKNAISNNLLRMFFLKWSTK